MIKDGDSDWLSTSQSPIFTKALTISREGGSYVINYDGYTISNEP